jgi:uncharacterized membrane protein
VILNSEILIQKKMRIRGKVVLTFIVSIITMFTINIIKNSDSEYNTGLLAIIIFFGCIAGVITIWSNNSKSLER